MSRENDKTEHQESEIQTDESQKADTSKDKSELQAIENHAVNLKISVSVLAAVKQSKKWATGKKVTKDEFEKAVKDFLGTSVSGKKDEKTGTNISRTQGGGK